MQSATVTVKGQVTIPKKYRDKFRIDSGKRVFFMETKNGLTIVSDDGKQKIIDEKMRALEKAQVAFDGFAEELGLRNIDDVVALVKQARKGKA